MKMLKFRYSYTMRNLICFRSKSIDEQSSLLSRFTKAFPQHGHFSVDEWGEVYVGDSDALWDMLQFFEYGNHLEYASIQVPEFIVKSTQAGRRTNLAVQHFLQRGGSISSKSRVLEIIHHQDDEEILKNWIRSVNGKSVYRLPYHNSKAKVVIASKKVTQEDEFKLELISTSSMEIRPVHGMRVPSLAELGMPSHIDGEKLMKTNNFWAGNLVSPAII